MLAVKFDKNRQFDVETKEWMEFAASLNFKRLVHFHAASHSDTERLDTDQEIWSIRASGDLYTFEFNTIEDDTLRQIVKWLIFKFLASYSLSSAYGCYRLFSIKEWTIDDLTLPVLYEKLDFCRRGKDGYIIRDFSTVKRVIDYLISNGAPGTEIEDLFELEQQVPGKGSSLPGYYDLELRLNPLEEEFIRVNSSHDVGYMHKLNYLELRDFVILRICYEVGLRPIQLFRLSKDSFQTTADKYFSIKRPWAKKGRANEHKEGTDNLGISPELGRAIQLLISQQNSQSEQLLQHEDGSDFLVRLGTQCITNTLSRWGAEDPHKTPYDFRHNVAHRMVMAGSSAAEIAYILGHNSLLAAQHYIAASPSISSLREKALARNNTYGAMIALLTGELALPENWQDKEVLGRIGDELVTGIGGCDAKDCEYVPVYNCYGCSDFHPFEDGNHDAVLDSLRIESSKIIAISDATRQSGMNPAMTQLEGVMEQVKAVVSRCRTCRRGKNAQ